MSASNAVRQTDAGTESPVTRGGIAVAAPLSPVAAAANDARANALFAELARHAAGEANEA